MNPAAAETALAVAVGAAAYPRTPPFHPGERYPEYPGSFPVAEHQPNPPYELVRQGLFLLGLDAEHFGSSRWNPLGSFIEPGQTVVIKPNLVRDRRETLPGLDHCVITHGAIIRAVVDYVYLALRGRGRIIIADAPMDDADFQQLCRITALPALQALYRERAGLTLEVYDLRQERLHKVRGFITGREKLPGDPAGYQWVDLGGDSAFREIEQLCDRLYGATYDVADTRRHHTAGRHEYLIARTILSADCLIALPKLKTHHKVGLTCAMKLMVGICGHKNCIAHYRLGSPEEGGDQFDRNGPRERLEHYLLRAFKRTFPLIGPLRRYLAAPLRRAGEVAFGRTEEVVRSGNWAGNDTAWRMAHDLTRIALYADARGTLHDRPVRRFLTIVDAIVAGEGNGPLDPLPHPLGMVIAGSWPALVDRLCGRLTGLDDDRLPLLARLADPHRLPLIPRNTGDEICRSNDARFDRRVGEIERGAAMLRPPAGWCHAWIPSGETHQGTTAGRR